MKVDKRSLKSVDTAYVHLNLVRVVIVNLYDANMLKDDEYEKLIRSIDNIKWSIFEDFEYFRKNILSVNEVFNRRYNDYE